MISDLLAQAKGQRVRVKAGLGILLIMAPRVVPQHQQIISSLETESLTKINKAGGTDNTLESFPHHAEPELISSYEADEVSAYTAFCHALRQARARALLRFLIFHSLGEVSLLPGTEDIFSQGQKVTGSNPT